jgi:hypothetical protein
VYRIHLPAKTLRAAFLVRANAPVHMKRHCRSEASPHTRNTHTPRATHKTRNTEHKATHNSTRLDIPCVCWANSDLIGRHTRPLSGVGEDHKLDMEEFIIVV